MDEAIFVFGSSKDTLLPFWRVWFYDTESKTAVPLAHYRDKGESDIAAFDLAESAMRLRDPDSQDHILAGRDADPAPLPPEVKKMIEILALEAIQNTPPAEPTEVSNGAHRREPDDIVWVVRWPVPQPA